MEPTTLPLPFANPFGSSVGRPLDDQDRTDVTDINRVAFKACQKLVEDVAAGGYATALTVFGDAGTGKTHLIGRVRRWLESQPGNFFVFVRMETSSAGIWRHIRRNLAMALLRPNSEGSRAIDDLLAHRKHDIENVDRDLAIVLENLLEGKHVRDSSAWLKGEGLPEEILASLRLSNYGPDEDAEVISRNFVLAFCGLIRPGVVVFCLDQIEAIMSSSDDREGPHAFARMVSCLVDETRNASVICCEQSRFMNMLDAILDEAAKERMFARRAPIHPLSWDQAQRLINARLNGLPPFEIEKFWALAEDKLKSVFTDNAAPARKVIARCKDLFDQTADRKPVGEALQGMLDERYGKKDPPETEAILRNGIPLLVRSASLSGVTVGSRSPLDFKVNGGQLSIAIINQANAGALAGRLKKITEAWKPAANEKLLLLRDARLPISPNAKVTHQCIDTLNRQGGRLLTISQEGIEALAALRRLLSDAESGDLAHHGESVAPHDVEKWIAGNRPASLDQLMSEFAPAAQYPSDLAPKLAALLADRKMVTLEEAARTLQVLPGEIEKCVRNDPRQFGLLGGRLPALFQPFTSQESR